jgi:hypothetical protein
MLNLLKEKSKIAYKPKKRRKFKPYMPGSQSTQPVTLPPVQSSSIIQPQVPKKIVPTILDNFDAKKDKDMK